MKTKNPSKNRKRHANAPMHKKQKLVSSHLSKTLRDKYKKRSLPIRKGDKVLIMRGKDKGKEGKVEQVILRKSKIYIGGIKITKNDGTEKLRPIDPSNVMIMELDLSDQKRINKIERGMK